LVTAVENQIDQETEMMTLIEIVALMQEEPVVRLAFSLSHVSCYWRCRLFYCFGPPHQIVQLEKLILQW
jgi:hypothetical protein